MDCLCVQLHVAGGFLAPWGGNDRKDIGVGQRRGIGNAAALWRAADRGTSLMRFMPVLGAAAALVAAVEAAAAVGDATIAANTLGLCKHAAEGRGALAERAALAEQRKAYLRQPAEAVAAVAADLLAEAIAAIAAEAARHRNGFASDADVAIVAAGEDESATVEVGVSLVGHAELPAVTIAAAARGDRAAIAVSAIAAHTLGKGNRIADDRDARALGRRAVGLEEGIAAAADAAIAANTENRIAADTFGSGEGAVADGDGADDGIGPGNPAEPVAAGAAVTALAARIAIEAAADSDRATVEDRRRSASAEAGATGPAGIVAAPTQRIVQQLAGDGAQARPGKIGDRFTGIAQRSCPGIVRIAALRIGKGAGITTDADRSAGRTDIDDRRAPESVGHARRIAQRPV